MLGVGHRRPLAHRCAEHKHELRLPGDGEGKVRAGGEGALQTTAWCHARPVDGTSVVISVGDIISLCGLITERFCFGEVTSSRG